MPLLATSSVQQPFVSRLRMKAAVLRRPSRESTRGSKARTGDAADGQVQARLINKRELLFLTSGLQGAGTSSLAGLQASCPARTTGTKLRCQIISLSLMMCRLDGRVLR